MYKDHRITIKQPVLSYTPWNEHFCNWRSWLEYFFVSFWDGLFSGAFAVSFRESSFLHVFTVLNVKPFGKGLCLFTFHFCGQFTAFFQMV